MQSDDARLKAAEYVQRAEDAFDEDTRTLFLRLHEAWSRVAASLELSDPDDGPRDLAA